MRRPAKRKNIFLWIFAALALGLSVCAGLWLWDYYATTQQPMESLSDEVVTRSTSTPSEASPDEACADYEVGPSLPKRISINSIGVDACIQHVGRDQYDAVAVPTNVHLAGWFVESSLPGDEGNSIIDGHVLGRYTDAVFVELGTVRTGDSIIVEFGDGSKQSFEVIDNQDYSIDEANSQLFRQAEGVDRQLTLITCGGTYNQSAATYDRRVIVRSQLVEG